MARLIVKLLSDDSQTDLASALAAYQGGAGAELLTAQRGQAMDEFIEPDGDHRILMALAHAGLDIPAAAGKTADLQHLDVLVEGSVTELQAAVDAALADAVHNEAVTALADTTVTGVVSTSTDTPFVAGDVGRKIRIGAEVRTITVFNSASNVDYDNSAAAGGDFSSGSGLTMDLLGAESLQGMEMSAEKSRSGELRMRLLISVEGELY